MDREDTRLPAVRLGERHSEIDQSKDLRGAGERDDLVSKGTNPSDTELGGRAPFLGRKCLDGLRNNQVVAQILGEMQFPGSGTSLFGSVA